MTEYRHNSIEWISEFLEATVSEGQTFDGRCAIVLTRETEREDPVWELKVFGQTRQEALDTLLELFDSVGWNDR